jgi:hypothetical protein
MWLRSAATRLAASGSASSAADSTDDIGAPPAVGDIQMMLRPVAIDPPSTAG